MKDMVFTFKGSVKTIHAQKWLCAGQPKALVQIVHGMAERAARYQDFAAFLTANDIAVYANDHLGHGLTVGDNSDEYGYFAPQDGWTKVVADIRTLTGIIRTENPQVPLFILGHSMGSLLVRSMAARFPEEVRAVYEGIILSATKGPAYLSAALGLGLADILTAVKGYRSTGKLLAMATVGTFNKHFQPARTKVDWMCSDPQVIDKFLADPYCGGKMKTSFYRDLISGVKEISSIQSIRAIPDLPLYLFSGALDPLGGFGRGVGKFIKKLEQTAHHDIQYKIYPGFRHEMLNETNKQQVYRDVLDWINSKL